MEDFTQFQLKEYENISQAHFKTNEVLATFYRYYFLITTIPITTLAVALLNLFKAGIGEEERILAYFIFGLSAIILSGIGVAIIAYIEGLRLDSILYARAVNSIRNFFFDKPESAKFGTPVLPRDAKKPEYNSFGASFLIYFACSSLNAVIFSSGVLALVTSRTTPLINLIISNCLWLFIVVCFVLAVAVQILIRYKLVTDKSRKGW